MNWLTSQGVKTYLSEEGVGAPTLFLHGAPDSADMWQGVIASLNGRYRCIAPDLPGFGRSIAPANFDYSLDNQARWVDGVVMSLGLTEPVNLIMHDFGGHFGLAWAIRHPDKVRRMVISNTNFFSDYQWHYGAQLLRMPLLGELMMLMTNQKSLADMMKQNSPQLTEAQLRQAYENFTPATRKTMLRLYRVSHPQNFRGWEDELLKLTQCVPTMVIWGDADQFAAPCYADRFGAQTVHHFAQYGHWVPVEGAVEFAAKLGAFL